MPKHDSTPTSSRYSPYRLPPGRPFMGIQANISTMAVSNALVQLPRNESLSYKEGTFVPLLGKSDAVGPVLNLASLPATSEIRTSFKHATTRLQSASVEQDHALDEVVREMVKDGLYCLGAIAAPRTRVVNGSETLVYGSEMLPVLISGPVGVGEKVKVTLRMSGETPETVVVSAAHRAPRSSACDELMALCNALVVEVRNTHGEENAVFAKARALQTALKVKGDELFRAGSTNELIFGRVIQKCKEGEGVWYVQLLVT